MANAPMRERCCTPHIDAVVAVRGRPYVAPTNAHAGLWFLPAARLARLVACNDGDDTWRRRRRPGDQHPHPGKGLPREHYAGMWLRRCRVQRLVPLLGFRRHLVHHATDAIVRSAARRWQVRGLVSVDDFVAATLAYAGAPLSVPRNRSDPLG